MKAKEIEIGREEFIKLLCSGEGVYVKKARSWQRQHLTVDSTRDPWFFTWAVDGRGSRTTVGVIIKTQLETWCTARKNEGCLFYREV